MVALVTVLYNSESVLDGFVECLKLQTGSRFLLIAIDNASSDRSATVLEKLCGSDVDLVLVRNSSNQGIAKANNQGIRIALEMKFEHIVLLNNDIEFEPTVLQDILSTASEKQTKILAPKVLFAGTSMNWYAGGRFGKYTGNAYHEHQFESTNEERERLVEYAPTCFVYFHYSVFEKVGLMDEDFFVYYDDTDFLHRCHKARIPVIYWPFIVIQHKVGHSTGGGTSPFTSYQFTKNNLMFVVKNYEGIARFVSLASVALLSLKRFITVGRGSRLSVLRGLRDFVYWFLVRGFRQREPMFPH